MNKLTYLAVVSLASLISITNGISQNALKFTSVNSTPEKAVQLHWASNSNEVYEIDYADSLIDTNTGLTTWTKLYDDYPSQGTNTFIADVGNYDFTPIVIHPKLSPMRFYRAVLIEGNTSPSNPNIVIVSPTNGATLSDTITVQVSASSSEILSEVELYIDGQEQWSSDDGTNFVINTCEYLNGNHTLFATAKSQSGLEGVANGGTITYGRSVSSFVNVTFNNLISEIGFSQPYFEPSLGQTQQITATFAANCNWTLQILDVNSNTVRNASGSGSSLSFNWDGNGDGGTNIPDGVYTYLISAQTNGLSSMSMLNNSLMSSMVAVDNTPITWALSPDSENPVPLAIYPIGFDTNGFTIFTATQSEIDSLTAETLDTSVSMGTSSMLAAGVGSENEFQTSSQSTSSSQSSTAPKRKPTAPVKGTVGTFGICYKTYSTNGFSSPHPTTGWPYPLPTLVAIDGQSRTAQTTDFRVLGFNDIATDFEAGMRKAGWKAQFVNKDDQWSATDIKKSSLGGNSIFNTCNFGLLMTHGSFGNSGSTGTEDDNISYTYCWLGSHNYVRLSDMDFGSTGTNGLRWMTIYACNMLNSANYNSMNNAGKIPVNENLHLLLAPSTTSYAWLGFGKSYAHDLTEGNETIQSAFSDAGTYWAHLNGAPFTIKFAVSGWLNCLNDKLSLYYDPDPSDGLQYQETQVYP